jgi:peptidoglycan hydrolase-like protein with peptidoglycan-binding domain
MIATLSNRRFSSFPLVRVAPTGMVTAPSVVSGDSIPRGDYTFEFSLQRPFPQNASAVRGNAARFGDLFNQAATALGVLMARDGAASFVDASSLSGGQPVYDYRWSIPVAVNGNTSRSEIQRALARAAFWSSDSIVVGGGGAQTVLPKDNADGGASIMQLLAAGRGGLRILSRNAGSQSNVVPGTAQPSPAQPPAPVQGNTITPMGGPQQTPAAQLLADFCQKRPKDSEGALAARERESFQAALTRLGFSTQGIDGTFGPNTRAAVERFQRANNLSVDGVIGPNTQAAIIRAICGAAATVQPPVVRPPTPAQPVVRPPTQGQPPVVRPPTPAPTPAPPVVRPPTPAQPPVVAEAGMGSGTILGLSLAAAAVGVGYAYRKELFGGKRK